MIDKPRTILIVDDDAFMREMVGRIIAKADQNVTIIQAVDGVDGLEMALHYPPDVAIIDVEMPRMDGETLSKKLRELYPQLPILIMTGFVNEETKQRLLKEVKVNDYLSKSSGFDGFYQAVVKLYK